MLSWAESKNFDQTQMRNSVQYKPFPQAPGQSDMKEVVPGHQGIQSFMVAWLPSWRHHIRSKIWNKYYTA